MNRFYLIFFCIGYILVWVISSIYYRNKIRLLKNKYTAKYFKELKFKMIDDKKSSKELIVMISNKELKELMVNTIEYIKKSEVTIDGEWGSSRTFEQLLKDNDVPEFYYDCVQILNKIKAFEKD